MAVTPEGIIRVLRFSFDMPLGSHAAVNVSGATPLKASFPMEVTLAGIVTEVKPLQPKNADSPMVVMPEGIVKEVKPEHRANVQDPISVTLSGIVKEVKR